MLYSLSPTHKVTDSWDVLLVKQSLTQSVGQSLTKANKSINQPLSQQVQYDNIIRVNMF